MVLSRAKAACGYKKTGWRFATARIVAVYSPGNRWKSLNELWKDAGIGPFRADGQQYAAMRIHEDPADRHGVNGDRRSFTWQRTTGRCAC